MAMDVRCNPSPRRGRKGFGSDVSVGEDVTAVEAPSFSSPKTESPADATIVRPNAIALRRGANPERNAPEADGAQNDAIMAIGNVAFATNDAPIVRRSDLIGL